MKKSQWKILLICFLGWIWAVVPTMASVNRSMPLDVVDRIIELQESSAAIDQRIAQENESAELSTHADRATHIQNANKLTELKFLQQRFLNELKKSMTSVSEKKRQLEEKKTVDSLSAIGKQQISLSDYDAMLDRRFAIHQAREMLRNSVAILESRMHESREGVEKSQQRMRRLKESLTSGADNDKEAVLTQAQIDCDMTSLKLESEKFRLNESRQEMQTLDLQEQMIHRQIEQARDHLAYDPADLGQVVAGIEREKEKIDTNLHSILEKQKEMEQTWHSDERHATLMAVEQAMQAREAWRETYEYAFQQTEENAYLLHAQQKLWQIRYAILKDGALGKQLKSWQQETDTYDQAIQQALSLHRSRHANLASRLADLEKKAGYQKSLELKYQSYHVDALKFQKQLSEDAQSRLMITHQISLRTHDELAAQTQHTLFWQKVIEAGCSLDELWNFELWVINDNGVTVRKVTTALVILVIGIFIIHHLTRSVSARLKKSKYEASAVSIAEKFTFYFGLLFVALFALRTVNIPLTAFTFLGGAIAIGVGFGAQNLISNFISGFIIMAERPIRIGDFIELDGKCVQVQEVGARCTRVKTWENIHVLVPNSSFLENSITNWTLSDRIIRTQVGVGVAYGSPVDKVTALLMAAADSTPEVLADPHPFVIFNDFGDNALVFEVYFYLKVHQITERKRIASQVRYSIYDLFSKEGIVIAFPQREIHVGSLDTVKVQLTRPNGRDKR